MLPNLFPRLQILLKFNEQKHSLELSFVLPPSGDCFFFVQMGA